MGPLSFVPTVSSLDHNRCMYIPLSFYRKEFVAVVYLTIKPLIVQSNLLLGQIDKLLLNFYLLLVEHSLEQKRLVNF